MSRNFLAKHHQVSEQNLMDKANVSALLQAPSPDHRATPTW